MSKEDKYCENCKHYCYTPNILGGIAECKMDIKALNTFWRNNACEKYDQISNKDIPEFFMPERLKELSEQTKNK